MNLQQIAHEMARNGFKQSKIADFVGRSVGWVSRKTPTMKRGPKPADTSLDQPSFEARAAGLTWRQVGERFGVSAALARKKAMRASGGVDPLGKTRPGHKRKRRG